MRKHSFRNSDLGIEISAIESCDFGLLSKVSNEALLKDGGRDLDPRLLSFIVKKMGVENRYHSSADVTALDLGRSALKALVEKNPELKEEAEFIIFAGISNPHPTTCLSALLSSEFDLSNVSCWDVKSGCSSGLLALTQAIDWVNSGSKCGIIVCAETLSKFSNPQFLQMSLATGDGAVAFSVKKSNQWKVLGEVHGTDARLFKSLMVPGKYPVDVQEYDTNDYYFHTDGKTEALEQLEHHWKKSLEELLEISGLKGSEINHYIPHQVDASKNKSYALSQGIPETSIASNIAQYGNMGCPTVFLNYLNWINHHQFKSGDKIVLHAVGGGISWCGISLEKL